LYTKNKPFKGHKLSQETKQKIGDKNKISQKGEANSGYNTCWIYYDAEKLTAKIKKDELYKFVHIGWKLGRRMKYKSIKYKDILVK